MPAGKSKKSGSPKKTAVAEKPKPAQEPIVEDSGSENGSDSDSDSDNGGVNEEGMDRLIKALGDDALDDFDLAQLPDGESDDSEAMGGSEDGESDEEAALSDEDDDDDSENDGEDLEEGDSDAEEDEDDEEAIALDDVESVDNDAVPRQKLEIDNHAALSRIRETIQLDPLLPWTETLVVSYPKTIDVDVDDDLNRELAFYKQALHGANAAKALAAKHKFPFTRPSDYFAEMVKSDSHMERIRQRLLDEGAGIKKSEEKRKEREGKKFGKQVQQEKLKERQQSKKDMEERLKGLKRKRKDVLDNPQANDDAFDIAVEDAISERPAKRGRGGGAGTSRQARDKKFGFGGVGRRDKQNTRESTDNFDSGSRKGSFRGGRGGSRGGGRGGAQGRGGGRGGGGGAGGRHSSKRLGKSRRMSTRGK